ncbi:ATP-dependent DNA helicase [Halieaceae bacterium IMCC14734]|uniref:ATP-dependent DNA helicase n=1 Tax=Candidatus Litorirhabdus singularis TaxID=2518993 RepID=A0ABT3TC12_9GAMM|nr:ATP-dependent DNA helicase [Candidatus Litorirhabdus singularis]MCX2979811.1 ATP-dependent DNA helicase [Candidatus Litorirhabdus singularis]
MHEYRVAVRELAEFCHRQGDIDYRFTPSPTAIEGIEGHQQVYQRRVGAYQAEHPVEQVFSGEAFSLRVSGRADGYDALLGCVEEIKTCRVAVAEIPLLVQQLHAAQALLYAGLICMAEPQRQQLKVRVCYFNIDTNEETLITVEHSRESALGFLEQTLADYTVWLSQLHQSRQQRDASINDLEFPHAEYRAGQREMAELVYKCVDQQGQLLLQAPTGIGKTAAVIFPALKAIARGKHDVVAFVTAKTVGRRAAEQTLASMQAQGLQLIAVSVTAKDRVCFSPGKACHGDDCEFAAGYYDRLPAARSAAVGDAQLLTRDRIEGLAREHSVCPYQLASDLLPWADFCVADIHYFYSLLGGLGAPLEYGSRQWSIVLDEAHNLPARARNMYAAELHKKRLLAVRKDAPTAVVKALNNCNRALLELQKQAWQESEFDTANEIPAPLLNSLQRLVMAVAEAMGADPQLLQRRAELRDFYFDTLQWLRVAENFGPDFRFEMRRRSAAKQSLSVRLNCLDPSRLLAQRQQRPCSVTAFTATANPPMWLLKSLGFDTAAVYQALPSPFTQQQFRVRINTGIDTRYQQREQSLPRLADTIAQWLRDVAGNCIVYFPSYAYMNATLMLLDAHLSRREVIVQSPEQDDAVRDELLRRLREESTIAAFCILGGVFGEGIDLPGDDLCSVVVVGVGMPQLNQDTRTLQDYYQATVGDGFEHAFVYPGMQKVSQALGRVIRTSNDQGQALLIDSRYRQPAYRRLLPPWWDYELD